MTDLNDLAYWFPLIGDAGLPLPDTAIVTTDVDLFCILDGEEPEGYDDFLLEMVAAAARIGWPLFLRTGHLSGKHDWKRTCFVPRRGDLARHIGALVEHSAMAGIMGLPTRTWALRKLIATAPMFVCEGYGDFPVTREFRIFVRDGEIVHDQPYWPPDACEKGRPDAADWDALLDSASQLLPSERALLYKLALRACEAVGGGYWSVDLLEDREGDWWLTDMAEGDRSFQWEGNT